MKKIVIMAGLVMLAAGWVHAALDATMLQSAQLLSVQEPGTDRTETELVAAQNFTTNATVTSTGGLGKLANRAKHGVTRGPELESIGS